MIKPLLIIASLVVALCIYVFVIEPSVQDSQKEHVLAEVPGNSGSLLIAPKLASLNCDDEGYTSRGDRCDDVLIGFLDRLEPGGPHGRVQFGYTLTIPIFEIFNKTDGDWVINRKRVRMYMDLIKKVNRPVVIHIGSNHFSPNYPIVREILQDPRNQMAYASGEVISSSYFKYPVHMFTLSTDLDLPINRYRISALRYLAGAMADLNAERPDLLHAVTLVGETYHLSKDIKNKMGDYFGVDFTDYSDTSKASFVSWLKKKLPSIEKLNGYAKTNFSDWDEVTPPYQDFRDTDVHPAWTHFDSFANGYLPVIGWGICGNGDKPWVKVYLDGKKLGDATYGLNRMDVYRNVKHVSDPNVGFRYMIDYRSMDPGKYRVSVSVSCGSQDVSLGSGDIYVLSRKDIEIENHKKLPQPKRKHTGVRKEAVTAYYGYPRKNEQLFFNQYAALWQEFRAYQVENYLRTSWGIFVEDGFPKAKAYCAQMVPYLQGSWNQAQLATDQSLSVNSPYLPSLMLYGGLAFNPLISNYTRGQAYGVSQFNPMMFKDKNQPSEAIQFHLNNGASFIAPYYMSVREEHGYKENDPHTDMLIYKGSPKKEAAYLYEAIVRAVRD